MIYNQYKDASLKHLQACKTALHGLSFYHNKSSAIPTTPQLNKDSLLLDIFYLTGYTLECIVNYAIYKKIGFNNTSDVKQMYNFSNKIAFFRRPNYPQTNNRVQLNGHDFLPSYWIEQHKFNKNIQLLDKLLPGNNIPLINQSVPISLTIQKMILETVSRVRNNNYWKPELRYEPANWILGKYTEQDIKDLVKLSEKIYIELQKV